MGNFFLDNQDIQFLCRHIDLQEIAALQEKYAENGAADYVPLDDFWQKRGYTRHPELRTEYIWQDLDETEASPKPMVFWLKRLDPTS